MDYASTYFFDEEELDNDDERNFSIDTFYLNFGNPDKQHGWTNSKHNGSRSLCYLGYSGLALISEI